MFFLFYILERKKIEKHFSTIKIMRQNKNKALSFDARVFMKERSITHCLKRVCIFHLIVVGLSTRLILFVKGLLTNDFNILTRFVC